MGCKDFWIRFLTGLRDHVLGFFRMLFRRLPFVLAALALLGILLSTVFIARAKESQFDQYAAERWGAETKIHYRQVSVIGRGQPQPYGAPDLFIDAETSMNKSTVIEIRTTLENFITSSGNEKTEADKQDTERSGRIWADAYYAEARASIRVTKNGEETGVGTEADLIGVAGSYYLFHPRRILEGSFLSEEIIDRQSVVLNEQLAWLLFRSNQIQDESVMIGSRIYTVVGVVREPDAKTDRAAGFDRPCAYIYFDELAFLSKPESNSYGNEFESEYPSAPIVADSQNLSILCYEAVLPDPIDGIALNDLKSSLQTYSPSEENFAFINHTGRFGLLRIIGELFPIGGEIPSLSNFSYPPGELSAQMTERIIRVWWVVFFTCLVLFIISLLAVVLTLRKGIPKRSIKNSTSDEPSITSGEKDVIKVRRV
ncbi:MAG: ABC transporter permease [Clostridiaceae bacterium]|nr:ABC transporter permease [Clostridiaceae bacterium]